MTRSSKNPASALDELLPAAAAGDRLEGERRLPLAREPRRGTAARGGWLQPVRHVHRIRLADLRGIDKQIERVEQNTAAVPRRPAGEQRAAHRRARHRQVLDREGAAQQISQAGPAPDRGGEERPRRPAADRRPGGRRARSASCSSATTSRSTAREDGYIALKVALDGSISTTSENLLIYATSNRRHLMPEYMAENLETKYVGDEIHPGETVEEKISLSERFGLWVTLLSVRPGRVPRHRRALAEALRRRRGERSPRAKKRCSGRCSAARAAAASPTSSRATGRARQHDAKRSSESSRSRPAVHRARRRRASCSRSAPRARSTPATGNFPAARSSRASRRRGAGARAARGARHRGASGLSLDHARVRLSAWPRAPQFLPRARLAKASRIRARTRRSPGSARRRPWSRRCCRRTRRCWHRSRCRMSTRSPMPQRLGTARMLAALERRLDAGAASWCSCASRRSSAAQRELFTDRGARPRASATAAKVLTKSPHAGRRRRAFHRRGADALERRPADWSRGAPAIPARSSSARWRLASISPCSGRCSKNAAPSRSAGSASPRSCAAPRIPVYAIGGLSAADLPSAWRAGAHGVAMIRAAWR